jgi:hypothetical protein
MKSLHIRAYYTTGRSLFVYADGFFLLSKPFPDFPSQNTLSRPVFTEFPIRFQLSACGMQKPGNIIMPL